MIKKLQKKFITITMMSLTLVMALLVGAINIINYYVMDSRTDGAIKILSENQGRFPKFEKDKPHKIKPQFGFQINAETQFETRYFVVEIDENGVIRKLDTSHIKAVSSEEAADYAELVLEGGKRKGYKDIYKFAVVEQEYGAMLIFVDCRSQIQTTKLFLLVSCGVGLFTLILVFILVSFFSRRAIKPFIISMEKQKQFITDAGHEIKTPLAIISANADVLELTGGESEWITSIRNQTTRLDKLVKNLLTLSKMEEGNIELVYTDFDLSQAVYEIAAPFEAIAEMQKKQFLMEIQPDLNIHGDLTSIHQLISTLMDNALKYSNEGGKVKITLTSAKKGVRLEVYNTAEEIDKENLNRLFDRFYRSDSSRSRETGGYGIGLSIAKSIVEAHHGKITVKSEDGKSISFIVILGA